MTIIDDRTPHKNLALPNEDNSLKDDVARLRSALSDIDTLFNMLDILLGSDDTTLDQVQELVNAIKDNRTTIDALLNDKADQTALDALKVEHEESQTLAAAQNVVDLAVLTSTAGATVFIEGVRLRASQWTPDGVVLTRLTLAVTYPEGTVITIVRRQGGA